MPHLVPGAIAQLGERRLCKPEAAGSSPAGSTEMADWRTQTLGKVRKLIEKADPEVVEEVKWRKPSAPDGVPVWSHAGMICTGETYKSHVKLTFSKGAQLKDPKGLFNAGLDGKSRRAIDLQEGDEIDEAAFEALIREAVALNES
jgi:hypothetical protein